MQGVEFIWHDMLNLGKRYGGVFTPLSNWCPLWGTASMKAWRILNRSQLGWKSM